MINFCSVITLDSLLDLMSVYISSLGLPNFLAVFAICNLLILPNFKSFSYTTIAILLGQRDTSEMFNGTWLHFNLLSTYLGIYL